MLRLVLIIVLGGVAGAKLANLGEPQNDLGALFAIGRWLALVLEVVAVISLTTPWWRLGAAVSIVLGSGALVATTYMVMQGVPPSSCGCFGGFEVDVPERVGLACAFIASGWSLLLGPPERGVLTWSRDSGSRV